MKIPVLRAMRQRLPERLRDELRLLENVLFSMSRLLRALLALNLNGTLDHR